MTYRDEDRACGFLSKLASEEVISVELEQLEVRSGIEVAWRYVVGLRWR